MCVSYRVCFACGGRDTGCFHLSGSSADGSPALGPPDEVPAGSAAAASARATRTGSSPFFSPASETPAHSQCRRYVASQRLRHRNGSVQFMETLYV